MSQERLSLADILNMYDNSASPQSSIQEDFPATDQAAQPEADNPMAAAAELTQPEESAGVQEDAITEAEEDSRMLYVLRGTGELILNNNQALPADWPVRKDIVDELTISMDNEPEETPAVAVNKTDEANSKTDEPAVAEAPEETPSVEVEVTEEPPTEEPTTIEVLEDAVNLAEESAPEPVLELVMLQETVTLQVSEEPALAPEAEAEALPEMDDQTTHPSEPALYFNWSAPPIQPNNVESYQHSVKEITTMENQTKIPPHLIVTAHGEYDLSEPQGVNDLHQEILDVLGDVEQAMGRLQKSWASKGSLSKAYSELEKAAKNDAPSTEIIKLAEKIASLGEESKSDVPSREELGRLVMKLEGTRAVLARYVDIFWHC